MAASLGGQAGDRSRPSVDDPWKRATPDRAVRLPDDHVAHPEYRIEWWYYTGNVRGDDGRAYGYQVTFFRVGVDASPVNPSAFAVRDLYMAHVAVTDIDGRRHLFADRLNRAGVHWAGARPDRYEVWNENWRASLDERGRHRLVVDAGAFALDLTLDPGKPVGAARRSRIQPQGAGPGQRVALLLAHAHADHGHPACGHSEPSPSRATAGWTTSSARAHSTRAPAAGTGSRSSWTTAAS